MTENGASERLGGSGADRNSRLAKPDGVLSVAPKMCVEVIVTPGPHLKYHK